MSVIGNSVGGDTQLDAKGVLRHLQRAFAGEPSRIPGIYYDPNETIPNRTKHQDPVRWVSAMAYPRPTQDSLPATGQALPDGLSTRKIPLKGFRIVSLHLIPLSQASCRNLIRRSGNARLGLSNNHRDWKFPRPIRKRPSSFPSLWIVRIYSPIGKIESCIRGKAVWLISPDSGPGCRSQTPVVG
jgi:hypothetical protein